MLKGFKPCEPVIIKALLKDSSRREWQSYAGFYTDINGTIDISQQAPANGSYNGVNGMGLMQFMNLPGADYNRSRFLFNKTEPLYLKLKAEVDGKTIVEDEVKLNFKDSNIKNIRIAEDGIRASLFMHGSQKNLLGVIVLGGSEGGLNGEEIAAALASNGYAAMALAYLRMEGLPPLLEEIPIEYFKKAIDMLMKMERVKKSGVVLLGISKGAEAVLITAFIYKEVKGVIAYEPSNVAWSCICTNASKSSWAYKGQSVPFIPQGVDPTYKPMQGFPFSPTVNYLYRYNKDKTTTKKAEIAVEKINGPVMLISGKSDQLWPSDMMAQEIMTRLRQGKHSYKNIHLSYPDAGHLIGKLYLPAGSVLLSGGRLNSGGTTEGNAFAQGDSWPKVLEFLSDLIK